MKTKLLLLLLLANFSLHAQTNLIPNGSFEVWSSSSQPDYWYRYFNGLVYQNATAQNGASSVNIRVVTGTFNYINSEYFPVTANQTYRVTLYHRIVKGALSSVDLRLYHQPSTFKEEITRKSDVTFSSTEWRKIEFEYTPTVSENIEVDIYANGSIDSEILIDNVSVVNVADIPLQYTKIPDVEFEKKLIALGIDDGPADGKVLTSKVQTVKSLTLDTRIISDLTGIQDFTALETLSANGGGYNFLTENADGLLKTLDVSKNLNLTSLSCYANKLTSLDISKNTKLTSLDFSANKIASIDITKNLNLNKLILYATLINTLDISKHQALRTFDCSSTKATSIDVSKNPGLLLLNVSNNKLTTLDVSKNTNLYALYCNSNSLTSIDTSKNLNLLYFQCFINPLAALDLSNNILLQTLDCSDTSLTTLDVSQNINLTSLSCGSEKLTSIDLTKNLKLESFTGSHGQFKTLDFSKNTNLSRLICQYSTSISEINLKNGNNTKISTENFNLTGSPSIYCIQVDDVNYSTQNWTKKDASLEYTSGACAIPSYTLIPDKEFEKLLIEKEIDGIEDGKVLTSKIEKIKVLNLSNTRVKYKIKDLTGIEDFAALEELKFPNNYEAEVAVLNLSKNQFLKKLDCRQSGITTLDVSKNTALTDLDCYGNKLTSLDVSKNTSLINLNCSYNRLTNLDVSKNVKLISLSCSASNKEGVFSLQQGLLTSLDVSKNSELQFLDCSMNDKLLGLDVSKNSNLKSINVSDNNLSSIDFSANKLLKNISCENNKITSLDVSIYPGLESLMCSNNQLTKLDVSKNPLLETLYCSNNKLASLDLSVNPNLKQLLCGSNNLTKLNLRNGGNTKMNGTLPSIFGNNPNLSCITVDDVAYSNKTWASYKDAATSYNIECGFNLPAKNFIVESKGESCLGENNGEINITASAEFPYIASINGKPTAFINNSLKVNNLTPGTYTIIVTIPGEVYEQTFNLAIAKAAAIAGSLKTTSKTVDVEITEGTAPFTIFVDGTEQFQTNNASFSVDINKNALIEVATAKACEGTYAKKVSISDFETETGSLSAYPNPTSGKFEIEIPAEKKEVTIELYNFGGQLVSSKTYSIENGKAQLNLENHSSGIYAAKIYLETPKYIKIIKR